MEEMKSRLLLAYVLMLIAYQAQVFEELRDHSFLVTALSDDVYILASLLLFCIPLATLYFVLTEKKWAYYMSVIYAVFMMFQGIERLVFLFVERTTSITLPVVLTGAMVCAIGIPMVYYLYMNIERLNKQSANALRYRAMIKID
jgi:hypothetical protein